MTGVYTLVTVFPTIVMNVNTLIVVVIRMVSLDIFVPTSFSDRFLFAISVSVHGVVGKSFWKKLFAFHFSSLVT